MSLTPEQLALMTEEERQAFELEDDTDSIYDPKDQENTKQEDLQDDKQQDNPDKVDTTAAQQAKDENQKQQQAEEIEPEIKKVQALFNAPELGDIEAERRVLDEKEDELANQFNDGDLTFPEYQAKLREINRSREAITRKELKAELALEAQQNQINTTWEDAQAQFFKSHPEFDVNNEAHLNAFDYFVRQETAIVQKKGGLLGLAELERAYTKYQAAFGTAKTTAPQQQKQQQVIPPTLSGVPAADMTTTDDGKYAHLDRLAETDPLAFDAAIANMSEKERDAYLAAG